MSQTHVSDTCLRPQMWLTLSWQQANGLAGIVVKCDKAEGSRGRWVQHVQPWGWRAAGSLDGSELYLTQVLP